MTPQEIQALQQVIEEGLPLSPNVLAEMNLGEATLLGDYQQLLNKYLALKRSVLNRGITSIEITDRFNRFKEGAKTTSIYWYLQYYGLESLEGLEPDLRTLYCQFLIDLAENNGLEPSRLWVQVVNNEGLLPQEIEE